METILQKFADANIPMNVRFISEVEAYIDETGKERQRVLSTRVVSIQISSNHFPKLEDLRRTDVAFNKYLCNPDLFEDTTRLSADIDSDEQTLMITHKMRAV